jgi:hypothetical protein
VKDIGYTMEASLMQVICFGVLITVREFAKVPIKTYQEIEDFMNDDVVKLYNLYKDSQEISSYSLHERDKIFKQWKLDKPGPCEISLMADLRFQHEYSVGPSKGKYMINVEFKILAIGGVMEEETKMIKTARLELE